ncbi:MAG TPA: NnrS family protein [Nitrososphaerales archaeon]|nr:NnrS family protein [Nitrososphaerales archaeon]
MKPGIFIGIALAFMMLALLTGIFRLMSDYALYPGILSGLYALHPIMMVFGFLATIVMAERVAGISVVPRFKSTRVAVAMVPLTALGVVSEIFGYATGPSLLRYVGSALLFGGCLAFLIVLIGLTRKTGIKLPFYFMILSVASLIAASVYTASKLPAGDLSLIMLLLSFPVIFILGERVELTRFVSSGTSSRKFQAAFVSSILAVALFALAGLPMSPSLESELVSAGLAMLFATFVVVLSAEVSNFRLLSKSAQPLQRYVSIHTRIAYSWGLGGIIFAEIYFLVPTLHVNLYDAFIHSIAVGFIGTMLLAHGPVILPSVTGRRLASTRVSILPLILLTVANLIRAAGDLLLSTFYSTLFLSLVGLSGWLVLASVLAFVPSILLATSPRKLEGGILARNSDYENH